MSESSPSRRSDQNHAAIVSQIVAYIAMIDTRFGARNPNVRAVNATWCDTLTIGIELAQAKEIIDRYYRQTRWDGSRLDVITPQTVDHEYRLLVKRRSKHGAPSRSNCVPAPPDFANFSRARADHGEDYARKAFPKFAAYLDSIREE